MTVRSGGAAQIVSLPGIPIPLIAMGMLNTPDNRCYVKARGNIVVDMSWKDGKVTQWKLRSTRPARVNVLVNGEHVDVLPEKA
jgi:hypothetical protein